MQAKTSTNIRGILQGCKSQLKRKRGLHITQWEKKVFFVVRTADGTSRKPPSAKAHKTVKQCSPSMYV